MLELEKLYHRLDPSAPAEDLTDVFSALRIVLGEDGKRANNEDLAAMCGVSDGRTIGRYAQPSGKGKRALPWYVANELRCHLLHRLGELPEWTRSGDIIHHNIYPRFTAYTEHGQIERLVWASNIITDDVRAYGRAWEHAASLKL